MKKKQFDVITVGSALRDVMYYTDESCVVKNPVHDPTKTKLLCVEYGAKIHSNDVLFAFGGGAANTAINFAGLGLYVGILASIGDDFDGRVIQEHLAATHVDTSFMPVSKKYRTGLSFLLVDKKTGEHAAYVYYGAAQDFTISASILQKYPTDWYYISSLNNVNWRQSLTQLFQQQTSIAWNPGSTQLKVGYQSLRRFIQQTDILILNKDEAIELIATHPSVNKSHTPPTTIKQMLHMIHQWGAHIVIITNGRKGAHAYDGDQYFFGKTPQDKPKDTTGAGDCFGSSFVTGYIRYQGDICKALELGNVNATALVHAVGAQQGLLQWKQLPKHLQRA